jgi:hypothetical protein
MLNDQYILLLHLFLTLYMTGLIWFVQIVHYPLMAAVGASTFRNYQQAHTQRTTWVVAPPMLLELGSGSLLLYLHHSSAWHWTNMALLMLIWASTFLIQVPIHNQLLKDFNAGYHRRLVRTNWLRTIAWTLRALLLLYLLLD